MCALVVNELPDYLQTAGFVCVLDARDVVVLPGPVLGGRRVVGQVPAARSGPGPPQHVLFREVLPVRADLESGVVKCCHGDVKCCHGDVKCCHGEVLSW